MVNMPVQSTSERIGGHFHYARDDLGLIQFFCSVVNDGAEDEAVYANQTQNDHLGPEVRIGGIFRRLRRCEQQTGGDHDGSPQTFPGPEAGDHLSDRHAVKRDAKKAQVRHQDHAAEQRDARQVNRQNDWVYQNRIAEVREKANVLERLSNRHAG